MISNSDKKIIYLGIYNIDEETPTQSGLVAISNLEDITKDIFIPLEIGFNSLRDLPNIEFELKYHNNIKITEEEFENASVTRYSLEELLKEILEIDEINNIIKPLTQEDIQNIYSKRVTKELSIATSKFKSNLCSVDTYGKIIRGKKVSDRLQENSKEKFENGTIKIEYIPLGDIINKIIPISYKQIQHDILIYK